MNMPIERTALQSAICGQLMNARRLGNLLFASSATFADVPFNVLDEVGLFD